MSFTPSNPPASNANASSPFPPPRVPDHELIRRIGRGAYGEVWLARTVTGAFRAVKIVHRQSFDHDRPFEREFEGILKFEPISRKHDSQVDILHVGRGDDCFYYVMELADDQATGGQINPEHYTPRTLKSDLLFRGRLPFEECVRIGFALATALENLHGNGLVHRDVKPSNIIFVNGVPKLADIGLVAGVEATRSYVGTEGFAAPEGPGSPRADLYSLGKVLYEISTGKDRQEFPELPTQLRELPDRDGLMELNAVIARACRHDPKDRYASATVMRADLELLQSGKSLARLHRLEGQLRLVRRAGAVVTVVAALIGLGWWWQARQTQLVRGLVEEKTQLSDANSRLADDNRERIVRLDVANGVRLLDDNDPSAALLWFADALPLVTNNPAMGEIHLIRIQQTLDLTPRLLNVFAENHKIIASAFSPDSSRIATTTETDDNKLTVRDAKSSKVLWELAHGDSDPLQIRFALGGQRLFVCSTENLGRAKSKPAPPDLQLAEVLDAATGRPVFPQLASNLTCSAFSPDDRWLAVALTNHVIRLLDPGNGKTVVEMKGHTNDIIMLAFSDDGSLLASGSGDLTARIWRLPSGELVGGPFIHDQPVKRVAFSAAGRYLATATWESWDYFKESQVRVWDWRAGKSVGETITQLGPARALFFRPNSLSLFTGGEAVGVRVWDVGTDVKLQRTLAFPMVRCWAFSPDGHMLALGTDVGFVSIWSTETWELLFPPFHHTSWVESVHFSPDGSRLLTTSADGTAKEWSLIRVAKSVRSELSYEITPWSADEAVHRGRTLGPIPVALRDNALRLIDEEKLTELEVLRAQETNATFMTWRAAPNGRYWAMTESFWEGVTLKGTVALWSLEGPGLRRLALPHPAFLIHLAFNPDSSRLLTFCRDWKVRVWRTSDGELEQTITVPPSLWYLPPSILPDAFSPDVSALMLGYGQTLKDQHLQLFDLATGELTGKPFALAKIPGQMNRLRFSPDGTHIASVGQNQKGTIIDVQTGELVVPQFKHGGDLLDVGWSPDGKRLITAGLSPEVKMWDAATGEMLLSPMTIGNAAARSACWSTDCRFIVTRSDDNLARVWDATTTEAVTPVLAHAGYVRWCYITPGNRLITASHPNLLRAWDLKPTPHSADVIADYAKFLFGRRLNAGGVLLPIPAKELADLAKSLRARAPQLFE